MIKHANMTLNEIVSQIGGIIISDMAGEKVMLSIEKGKYYNLGEIGGAIWEQIKVPTSIDSIVATLISNYDVKQHECEEQVILFLEQLLKEDLIKIENYTSK